MTIQRDCGKCKGKGSIPSRGKHIPHQGKIHCSVFDGMGPNDIHTSWNYNVVTEEVTELHARPNSFRGQVTTCSMIRAVL